MISKTIMTCIICFISVFQLKSQDLYVWADKLNLREVPNGKVISKMTWGEKVKVVERFTSESFDTLNLKLEYVIGRGSGLGDTIKYRPYSIWGEWVKIEIDQKIGYVFDAYLSKIPPPKVGKNNKFEPFEEYFKRDFGISTDEKIGCENCDDNYRRLVSKDKTIELRSGFMGKAGGIELIFESIPLKEARLIGYQLFKKELNETCDLQILKNEKKLIIASYCSC